MKYLNESDPRFQHLGLKVASFLSTIVVLLLVMAALLGWRQDFFVSTVVYRSKPGQADAIFPGMDVTMRGIHVGRVVAVGFDAAGQPEIMLRVREKPTVWLRADAVARLTGMDPLATPFIDLIPGTSDRPPLPPGSLIPFERELSFAETANRIQKELSPVVAAAAELVGELNRPGGDVRETLRDVHELSRSFAREGPPILLDLQVSAAAARAFVTEMTATDADLRKTVGHLHAISERLDRKMPEMLDKLDASLTALHAATSEIRRTTHATAPQVQELMADSETAVKKADELVSDFRRIWIFKFLAPRKERAADPDNR